MGAGNSMPRGFSDALGLRRGLCLGDVFSSKYFKSLQDFSAMFNFGFCLSNIISILKRQCK